MRIYFESLFFNRVELTFKNIQNAVYLLHLFLIKLFIHFRWIDNAASRMGFRGRSIVFLFNISQGFNVKFLTYIQKKTSIISQIFIPHNSMLILVGFKNLQWQNVFQTPTNSKYFQFVIGIGFIDIKKELLLNDLD